MKLSKCFLLFLCVLTGCKDDIYREVARCTLDAEKRENTKSFNGEYDLNENIRLCMQAAGYKVNDDLLCRSALGVVEDTAKKDGYCYRPMGSFSGLVYDIENTFHK